LTTLGKVIGGGLPVGAYGGRKDIMSKVAPAGPIYQAGTLSGKSAGGGPLGWRCCGTSSSIPKCTTVGGDGAKLAAIGAGGNHGQSMGSMFTFFLHRSAGDGLESAKTCDTERFGKFFRGMLERGIYLAPSQFEPHSCRRRIRKRTIEKTILAAREVL